MERGWSVTSDFAFRDFCFAAILLVRITGLNVQGWAGVKLKFVTKRELRARHVVLIADRSIYSLLLKCNYYCCFKSLLVVDSFFDRFLFPIRERFRTLFTEHRKCISMSFLLLLYNLIHPLMIITITMITIIVTDKTTQRTRQ